MQDKQKIARNMLAIVVLLLSLTCLCSCASSKKMSKDAEKQSQADSVDVFIPRHPHVIIPLFRTLFYR